jgi:hypothetical protein
MSLAKLKGDISELKREKSPSLVNKRRKHPINRKPVERQGRKVMGLNPPLSGQDCQTTENEQSRFRQSRDLDAQMKEFFMASRFHPTQFKNRISASALVILLACILALPAPVYAKEAPSALPALDAFIETVKDGNAAALRGVYVPGVMAFAVEQQPVGYPGYVSEADSVVTQFSIAAEMGNVGLLAHNTHAGAFFSNIQQGSLIVLVYGDGHTETFMAQSIQQYQALDPYNPYNPYSQFKDLEMQTALTAEELFNKVYRGDYHLTLQTCIENNGNESWGRLFIVAVPVDNALLAAPDKSAEAIAALIARRHLQ